MIDYKLYRSKPNEWWKGKKVRTLVELRNGWFTIKSGTICTIYRKYMGFELTSDPCKECGIQVSIARVHPNHLELVEGN